VSRLRVRSLGSLSVDTGDVICFSSDAVLRMVEQLGGTVEDSEAFISRFQGVPCQFHADGRYAVDQLVAVANDGETYDVAVIGGNWKRFARFLGKDEPTFDEFLASHPDASRIGEDKQFKLRIFQRVCREYQELLTNKANRMVPRSRRRHSNG
jgi:hypothetical protein